MRRTDASPNVTDSPGNPVPEPRVVAFENLSADAQRKVRAALRGGYRSEYRPGTDGPSVFQNAYVRYRNETYRPERRMTYDESRFELTLTPYGTDETDDR